MDRGFFERLEQIKREFAARAQLDGEVGVELALANGRAFEVTRVVEVTEGWVHVDGRDLADVEEKPLSIVVPYFQINVVQFSRQRPRSRPGFLG